MAIQVHGHSTGNAAEVETNTRALRVAQYPNDFGNNGSFAKTLASGTITAGLGANGSVYHFRTTAYDLVCRIRRVILSASNAGTAFAAGAATFRLVPARFTGVNPTQGTLGSLGNHNSKLRTGSGSSRISINRYHAGVTVSGGMITIITSTALGSPVVLDTDPIAAVTVGVSATANDSIMTGVVLYEAPTGQYALTCAEWEGFTIQAKVPATGTWTLRVTTEWEELSSYC